MTRNAVFSNQFKKYHLKPKEERTRKKKEMMPKNFYFISHLLLYFKTQIQNPSPCEITPFYSNYTVRLFYSNNIILLLFYNTILILYSILTVILIYHSDLEAFSKAPSQSSAQLGVSVKKHRKLQTPRFRAPT